MAKNDFSYKKLTSDLNDVLPNGKEHERVEAMFAKLTAPARTTTAQSTLSTPAAMTAAKPTPPQKSTPHTTQPTKKKKNN